MKNVQLDAIDLVQIKTCMEDSIKSTPASTLNPWHEKTLEKVNAIIEFNKIELILASRIEEIKLEDIALVLDINDRKRNQIFGLDYYYADGMIGAFVPNSNDMRYSWENAQDFMNCHGYTSVEDLQEFNPRK